MCSTLKGWSLWVCEPTNTEAASADEQLRSSMRLTPVACWCNWLSVKASQTAKMPPAGTETKQTSSTLLQPTPPPPSSRPFSHSPLSLWLCSSLRQAKFSFLSSFLLPLLSLPPFLPSFLSHSSLLNLLRWPPITLFSITVFLSPLHPSLLPLHSAISTIKTWLQSKPPGFVSGFEGEKSRA